MKIVAYSQVPQKHSYVHLAYLSAAGQAEGALTVAWGLLLGIIYLVIYFYGLRLKLNTKFPWIWRLAAICFIIAILFLLLHGCLAFSGADARRYA
jgi:hypothetical protein